MMFPAFIPVYFYFYRKCKLKKTEATPVEEVRFKRIYAIFLSHVVWKSSHKIWNLLQYSYFSWKVKILILQMLIVRCAYFVNYLPSIIYTPLKIHIFILWTAFYKTHNVCLIWTAIFGETGLVFSPLWNHL